MLIPPQECPCIVIELMKNCWKTEPRHRITFPNICDKLELAFENMEPAPQIELKFENEVKKSYHKGGKIDFLKVQKINLPYKWKGCKIFPLFKNSCNY